ncbi:MAG: hypothetical protein J6R42_05945 [Clostridia bacterium]|nr:hypothetical protein [Clostridia bacterium]
MKSLFSEEGRFYRAALHTHSSLSDGELSPEQLKAYYRAHGFDILAIVDHEVFCSHDNLCESDFLVLSGYEIAFGNVREDFFSTPTCHISLIAKNQNVKALVGIDTAYLPKGSALPLLYEGKTVKREYSLDSIASVLEQASEAGFLPFLNHPAWSLENPFQFCHYPALGGVEVYNHLSYMEGGQDNSALPLDLLLSQGQFPLPLATDDFHGENNHGTGGFTMICATSLAYEDVIFALEAGQAYASNGPLLYRLFSEDGYLRFSCSGIKEAALITPLRPTSARIVSSGEDLYYGEFAIPPSAPWVRLELTDREGKKLWTRAYKSSEL